MSQITPARAAALAALCAAALAALFASVSAVTCVGDARTGTGTPNVYRLQVEVNATVNYNTTVYESPCVGDAESNVTINVTYRGLQAALELSCNASIVEVYVGSSGNESVLFIFSVGGPMNGTGTLSLEEVLTCMQEMKVSLACVGTGAPGRACVKSEDTYVDIIHNSNASASVPYRDVERCA